MTKSIKSIINYSSGLVVDIECYFSNNLPTINIIGFASRAVDEAKDRLRASFTNSGLALPKKHIVINLSPADIPKESTSLDLAMATAILAGSGQIHKIEPEKTVFLGELGLDGGLKPVRGIIGSIIAGKRLGIKRFFIPELNRDQAILVPGVTILPVSSLRQLYLHFTGTKPLESIATDEVIAFKNQYIRDGATPLVDFADISGQAFAKRALEVAAAGHHNILLNGQPGVGKTLLAKAFAGILPQLTPSEMLEVTQIHSLHISNFSELITNQPYRSPHHGASVTSLVGGGSRPLPGEVSLAHKGVLFLDEISEFNRSAIEALRQPMEDRYITVARVKESVTYPADFVLIATQNPCPCGYYGSSTRVCECSAASISQYQRRISGPILDRIDIHVATEAVNPKDLLSSDPSTERSASIAIRVAKARKAQQLRLGPSRYNSSMSNSEVRKTSYITSQSKDLLDTAASKMDLSARAYFRCIKVARTIADLDSSHSIQPHHIAEALQYRTQTSESLLTSVT